MKNRLWKCLRELAWSLAVQGGWLDGWAIPWHMTASWGPKGWPRQRGDPGLLTDSGKADLLVVEAHWWPLIELATLEVEVGRRLLGEGCKEVDQWRGSRGDRGSPVDAAELKLYLQKDKRSRAPTSSPAKTKKAGKKDAGCTAGEGSSGSGDVVGEAEYMETEVSPTGRRPGAGDSEIVEGEGARPSSARPLSADEVLVVDNTEEVMGERTEAEAWTLAALLEEEGALPDEDQGVEGLCLQVEPVDHRDPREVGNVGALVIPRKEGILLRQKTRLEKSLPGFVANVLGDPLCEPVWEKVEDLTESEVKGPICAGVPERPPKAYQQLPAIYSGSQELVQVVLCGIPRDYLRRAPLLVRDLCRMGFGAAPGSVSFLSRPEEEGDKSGTCCPTLYTSFGPCSLTSVLGATSFHCGAFRWTGSSATRSL